MILFLGVTEILDENVPCQVPTYLAGEIPYPPGRGRGGTYLAGGKGEAGGLPTFLTW